MKKPPFYNQKKMNDAKKKKKRKQLQKDCTPKLTLQRKLQTRNGVNNH